MSAFAAPDNPDTQDYSYTEPDPATTTPPLAHEQTTSPDLESSHSRSRSNNPLLGNDNPLVSELEQEVLDEYSRLLRNVNQVSRAGSRDLAPRVVPFPKIARCILYLGDFGVRVADINSCVHPALRENLRPRRFPSFHDPRWPPTTGAQDGDGVHTAQG